MFIDEDAVARALGAAHDIEREFLGREDGPLAMIVTRSRRECIKAMGELIKVDPTNASEVRRLQNDCRRYGDMMEWMRNIIAHGRDAEAMIPPDEREAVFNELNRKEVDDA